MSADWSFLCPSFCDEFGKQRFYIPIFSNEEYLSVPRHARWPLHLQIAMVSLLIQAWVGGDFLGVMKLVLPNLDEYESEEGEIEVLWRWKKRP